MWRGGCGGLFWALQVEEPFLLGADDPLRIDNIFSTLGNLLKTSTLSLTQITWDNSAGPRPSATVRGTRTMSLGWTGWAGGLWGMSGWFGDDDDVEGDEDYHWTGRAEPGGCETYHHDDFNSNKFQIRAHDDGNDVCLAGKSVSSGRWREGSGLGSPVGGTGGTPVHWVVSSILLCIINHITIWLAIQMVHLLCYQI